MGRRQEVDRDPLRLVRAEHRGQALGLSALAGGSSVKQLVGPSSSLSPVSGGLWKASAMLAAKGPTEKEYTCGNQEVPCHRESFLSVGRG